MMPTMTSPRNLVRRHDRGLHENKVVPRCPVCAISNPEKAAKAVEAEKATKAEKAAAAEMAARKEAMLSAPKTITKAEYERRDASGKRLPGAIRRSAAKGSVVSSASRPRGSDTNS
jgi:hypothetical protein